MALFLDDERDSTKLDLATLLDFLQIGIIYFLIYVGLYYVPSLSLDHPAALLREQVVMLFENGALILLSLGARRDRFFAGDAKPLPADCHFSGGVLLGGTSGAVRAIRTRTAVGIVPGSSLDAIAAGRSVSGGDVESGNGAGSEGQCPFRKSTGGMLFPKRDVWRWGRSS